MLKNNLIFIKVVDNYIGFLDTGGGMTFQFSKPELNNKVKLNFSDEEITFQSKKVIVFYGNDYWFNKIYTFYTFFSDRKSLIL